MLGYDRLRQVKSGKCRLRYTIADLKNASGKAFSYPPFSIPRFFHKIGGPVPPGPPRFDATELELCYSCVTLCVKSIEASKWKGHYDNLALFWLFSWKWFGFFWFFYFYCLALCMRRHQPTLIPSPQFARMRRSGRKNGGELPRAEETKLKA